MDDWKRIGRPGYFGKRRDEKIADLDRQYGKGVWQLRWIIDSAGGPSTFYDFEQACKALYEESYFQFLSGRPDLVDFICGFGECIDNDETNISSGLDYTKQESRATHIQDIAVRNVLARLGRKFEGEPGRLLVIRGNDSSGFRFNPGNITFAWPDKITQPSIAPRWAGKGSVEDFWQSNKWIVVPESVQI